jgi:hypothetical protein
MVAVTLEEFKDYVGTKDATDFPELCLDAGNALVGRLIGTSDEVPADVHKQAILIAASEIFHRRNAPQGISQFADATGTPIRVGRDPMAAVYPLLLPFIGYGV